LFDFNSIDMNNVNTVEKLLAALSLGLLQSESAEPIVSKLIQSAQISLPQDQGQAVQVSGQAMQSDVFDTPFNTAVKNMFTTTADVALFIKNIGIVAPQLIQPVLDRAIELKRDALVQEVVPGVDSLVDVSSDIFIADFDTFVEDIVKLEREEAARGIVQISEQAQRQRRFMVWSLWSSLEQGLRLPMKPYASKW